MPIPPGPDLPLTDRAMIERQNGPPYPAAPQLQFFDEGPEGEGIDLRELWRVLLKRRWTIVVVTVIVVAAVVTSTYMETPIYRASLVLQIDREDSKVVDLQEVSPVDYGYVGLDYLQTQYELLKSRNLAQHVVERMRLADRPAQAPQPSLLDQARAWLVIWLRRADTPKAAEGAADARRPDPSAESARIDGVVSGLLAGLTVAPVTNSRLVRLYYDSPDPKLAAAILNNLAKSFIDLNLERRFEATTYARNFLQERLQQVKEKLEESERDLVDFSRREEIIAIDQKETIIAGNLAAASAAVIDAERERIASESVYRQMQANRGEGLTQVLDSKIIQDLKQTKAKLEAEYQDNLTEYKPGYPAMVQLRNRINQVDSMITAEVGNIRMAIASEYQAAKAQETQLRSNLDRMKQEVLALQSRSVPLQVLRREADTNRQLYDGLLQRYKEVGVAAGVGSNNISVVDDAKVPTGPFKPNPRRNALVALVMGLMGGIGLAFLFERLDDTFRRPEELEKLLDLPMLGIVPMALLERGDDRAVALSGHDDPRSAFAEAYRTVRTALQFSTASGVPRLLTVTSSMPGEGKTTTALSLAIQFAQSGKQTLLIEADLRKPTLHRALGLDNRSGLTNYLAGGEVQPVDIALPTHIPRLFAIPSGPMPPNPAELLASARMVELLALAAEKFDQVILDSPPLLGLADALIIGNLCEGTLLTVEVGHTPRAYAQGAVKRLRAARVPLLGAVLTKMDSRSGADGYYRSYYYHRTDYYGDLPGGEAKKLPV